MNSANNVKISKRPHTIAMVSTHLALSGIAVIFCLLNLIPGPRLLILANTALKASKGSTPHAITLNKQIVNTNRYAEKKGPNTPKSLVHQGHFDPI